MNRIPVYLVLVVLATLFIGCREDAPKRAAADEQPEIVFRQDGTLDFLSNGERITRIRIEIADDEASRARGLMGREALPTDGGMLFIFDRQEVQSFWMANTPLSLDIFFVDRDSSIVRIAKYTRPFSHESVSSVEPAMYVVETAAGFADRHGIVEGDRIAWERE
jgi:uncharacterized protein